MKLLKNIVGAALIGIILFFITTRNAVIINKTYLQYEFYITLALYILLTVIPCLIVNYFYKYIRHRKRENLSKLNRVILVFVGGFLLVFAIRFLTQLGIYYLVEERVQNSTTDFSTILKAIDIAGHIMNYTNDAFVISIIYLYLNYNASVRDSEVKEQKVIAKTESARFEALKSQLDPHFLFNSLNVLTGLIEENPELASKFTTSLSKVYRYVLEQKNKELVTLEEELEFARVYLSLLTTRFENSLECSLPIELKNPEVKVVPLSLQLLLENAVKHNQITEQNKLVISIYEQDDYLIVSNNLQPKNILKQSTGLGLKNIQERYALFTDASVLIDKTTDEFRVGIPLLDPNTRIEMNTDQFINEKRYKHAKEQVEAMMSFRTHFAIYLVFCLFFIFMNIRTGGFPWAIFPIIGWGIGVLSHASKAYNYSIFPKAWEKRKINQFMGADKTELNYLHAKEKVESQKSFYTSLLAYIIVIGFLLAINYYYLNRFHNTWVLWASIGWGIGIFFQGLNAFDVWKRNDENWKEKKIQEILEKEEYDKYKDKR